MTTAACAFSWLAVTSAALAAVPPNEDEEIPLASAHAAAVETPSSPEAWGGARAGNEPTLSDRVVSYDIDATLDPKTHTVARASKSPRTDGVASS